ncbi:MbnP family protein [Neolewinella antarctica]|uniref:Copper-binding protein MbnP-like domain-containing protein n=1 Tax=Neolewinella antarctica TaxID=442734 RepID=A0ABX0XEP0_9BACT|nr:MbnP family protein [Neolewinella antarctica]NJC27791.1 hypothetical protein [Neolewinella antarctica]
MKYLSAAFLLLALLFVSCEDDEDPFTDGEVELQMNFTGDFDGRDLMVQSEAYAYPGGGQLKFQLFQYYVSDLQLVPADGGDPVILSEIELIRYASATEDNVESRTFTVPSGDYSAVRFGLGVKPALNNTDPNNFSANDPLNENEFWNANARYVFAKIEANADLEGDDIFDAPVTIHMGSDALYRTVTLSQDVSFRPGTDAELTVVADIFQAFGGNSDTYDLTVPANRRVHGGNQNVAAGVFNRLAEQFKLTR